MTLDPNDHIRKNNYKKIIWLKKQQVRDQIWVSLGNENKKNTQGGINYNLKKHGAFLFPSAYSSPLLLQMR